MVPIPIDGNVLSQPTTPPFHPAMHYELQPMHWNYYYCSHSEDMDKGITELEEHGRDNLFWIHNYRDMPKKALSYK